MFANVTRTQWLCPGCGWVERAHGLYGWSRANERAVEVHREQLCPFRAGADEHLVRGEN